MCHRLTSAYTNFAENNSRRLNTFSNVKGGGDACLQNIHCGQASPCQTPSNVLRILGPGPLAAVATVVYMTATTLYCSTVLFPDDIRRILNITSFGGQLL